MTDLRSLEGISCLLRLPHPPLFCLQETLGFNSSLVLLSLVDKILSQVDQTSRTNFVATRERDVLHCIRSFLREFLTF